MGAMNLICAGVSFGVAVVAVARRDPWWAALNAFACALNLWAASL